MKLKISDEYRRLLPSLPPGEYEALKNSIIKNGLLNPLDVNPEGVIVDGINRFKARSELGMRANEPGYKQLWGI